MRHSTHDPTMSSVLARSALRAVRHAPQTRIPLARYAPGSRCLHRSARRPEELKVPVLQAGEQPTAAQTSTAPSTSAGSTDAAEDPMKTSPAVPVRESALHSGNQPTIPSVDPGSSVTPVSEDAASSTTTQSGNSSSDGVENSAAPLPPIDAWTVSCLSAEIS